MEMMDQRIMENRAECVPFIIGIMSRCLKEDRERERFLRMKSSLRFRITLNYTL